eukprot:s983_g23.t1
MLGSLGSGEAPHLFSFRVQFRVSDDPSFKSLQHRHPGSYGSSLPAVVYYRLLEMLRNQDDASHLSHSSRSGNEKPPKRTKTLGRRNAGSKTIKFGRRSFHLKCWAES